MASDDTPVPQIGLIKAHSTKQQVAGVLQCGQIPDSYSIPDLYTMLSAQCLLILGIEAVCQCQVGTSCCFRAIGFHNF